MIGTRDLQTTMLEGNGMAPLNLNTSAINNKSMFGKAPLLGRTMSKKAESKFFITSQKGEGGLSQEETENMTMESHILMLTLLSVKTENNLALLEKAEDNLGPYAMKNTEASADSCLLSRSISRRHHPQCPNGGSGPFLKR